MNIPKYVEMYRKDLKLKNYADDYGDDTVIVEAIEENNVIMGSKIVEPTRLHKNKYNGKNR